MAKFDLGVWVTRPFPAWTHVIKGSFADPQSATQGATDLFCYDQNTRVGAFFATVRSGRLNDGTIVQDGPRQVGPNHTFEHRWTHIATGRFPDLHEAFPVRLLFHDAVSGNQEDHATDGRGGLKRIRFMRTSNTTLTHLLTGRFGDKAGILMYHASLGKGQFWAVDNQLGQMRVVKEFDGWRGSWHSIVAGNFSNSAYDDLLFYDKAAGVGEFYRLDGQTRMAQIRLHDNWRRTWQHVVPGQYLQNAAFDGLLFYEEGSAFTEFYATNGSGGISKIDIDPGGQWRLPWHTILPGEFTPNIGLVGTSRLCAFDQRDKSIRYFFLQPATISTVLDLNGRWTAGGPQRAVISSVSTSLTVDMTAYNRPAAHGSIVDASTITVTFPDDASYTGRLQAPNTIRWSNGTSWLKV